MDDTARMDSGTRIVFEPWTVPDSGEGFGQPESPAVRMMLSGYADSLTGIGNLEQPSHLQICDRICLRGKGTHPKVVLN